MFFGKDLGTYEKYEKLKKDDFSVNEKYWKKYEGISEKLAYEIPKDIIYEIVDNYVWWILGDSYDDEMDKKLKTLPEILRYAYLVNCYEGEINNGGFDQFYYNSIGYEVFEIQKALEYFGLKENKKIFDESIELLKQKIDLKNYYELSASRDLPTDDLEEEFSQLDSTFYEYPENITEIVNTFLDKNRSELVTIK